MNERSLHIKRDLPKWIATVYIKTTAFPKGTSDSTQCSPLGLRMAPVQRTISYSECEVIGRFTLFKLKRLNRDLTKAQLSGSNLGIGSRHGLTDCLGRTIDAKDMPVLANALSDCTRRRARPAANL